MLTAKGQSNETRGQENNSITVTVLVTKYETEEVGGCQMGFSVHS